MSTKFDNISSYVLPTFYSVATHPLTHARTLMQLGYEPAPPYLGNSMMSAIGIGQKCYKYPSIFTYCKYMRDDIGLLGIFTVGLPARVLCWHLSSSTSDVVLTKMNNANPADENRFLNPDVDLMEYVVQVRNLTIARTVATVVSYPFQVIMVRQMAEILNEGPIKSKYMFTLIFEIFDEEGIFGFFRGLPAKLIGEFSSIWTTAVFVYVINKHVLKDRVAPDIKEYSSTVGGFFSSGFTYRFAVISTLMSVSGSKISGTMRFKSIWDCYSYLSSKRGFTRGSSLFLRYVQ